MMPRASRLEAAEHEVVLFGAKQCPKCGQVYAANTDYFAPDRSKRSGLTCLCRNCRREYDRR